MYACHPRNVFDFLLCHVKYTNAFGSPKKGRLPITSVSKTVASVCFGHDGFRKRAFRYGASRNGNRPNSPGLENGTRPK